VTTSSAIRVNSSSLQWKHRSGPFARYASRSPSNVVTSATATPMNRATAWAPSRSAAARLGETPRIATTRSGPSSRTASASSTDESTPPEKATPSRPTSGKSSMVTM
jgi:hypothetical protein